jgi:NAD(P)-dependent dehydrogenase (short-subunit alcohol dehydrogenase family)
VSSRSVPPTDAAAAAAAAAAYPTLVGAVVVVTGATSGIGRETARLAAQAGATVVLAVRDIDRGAQVAREIGEATEIRHVDLADLASIRSFAADMGVRPIDILVNNAGVMATPRGRTVDGFETQIGVNHLGPFALTNLLLPHIRQRVVSLSSVMHGWGRIRLDDLQWQHRRYRRWRAYGDSKLADLLFTAELQRRLAAAGSPVLAVAAHPGYVATALSRHTGQPLYTAVLRAGEKLVAQSPEAGARPVLFAMTADMPPGGFAGPGDLNGLRGAPTLVSRSARAQDADLASRLWQESERLTGVSFGLPLDG